MKPIVVDASMIVEYLLGSPRGSGLEAALLELEPSLHVPALCDIEVCSVLRRALLRRNLSEKRSYQALEDYLDLPLERHGHTYLLTRIVGLRANFSAYDAAYLALAEWLDASLLTADESLARAVGTHLEIEIISEPGP